MAYADEVMEGIQMLVGDHLVSLSPETENVLREGGRLIGIPTDGSVLVIPASVRSLVETSVTRATRAFTDLQLVPPEDIDAFFRYFAELIEDDSAFADVLEANTRDVETARTRGRAIGRLLITPKMRADMAAGLRMWADLPLERLQRFDVVNHGDWVVESWRAPLGVVGFVFEGRPNVFADAMGVLKSGNAVVFRIGSDALGTARAIRDTILQPALAKAGLPADCVGLIDSAEHAAGWALFGDTRLSLAVVRGSGAAVAQLGEVARQSGVPVSLHGTGGAWMIVGSRFDGTRLRSTVRHSLDRKVCNTLNTIVLTSHSRPEAVVELRKAFESLDRTIKVHVDDPALGEALGGLDSVDVLVDEVNPGHEWEWDENPEVTVILARDVAEAVERYNLKSPQFVLSVVSDDESEVELAWRRANAPFFGDGFTRWVDGQFALERPELGLANWQNGRLLGRGGVLSGDGVHTVRLRVRQADAGLHR